MTALVIVEEVLEISRRKRRKLDMVMLSIIFFINSVGLLIIFKCHDHKGEFLAVRL